MTSKLINLNTKGINIKNLITILILLFTLSFPLFSEKMNIAVIEFKADGVSKLLAGRVSELIRGEMINIKKYSIIGRTQMEKALREHGFLETECDEISCAVEIGRILSVKKIIAGTVMDLGGSIVITGNVVDVDKGVSEFSEKQSVSSEKTINEAVSNFTNNLTNLLKFKLEPIIHFNEQIFILKIKSAPHRLSILLIGKD